jgi:hypothetical protein
MKAIRMILGGTVFFTVILAIMLAPAMIMAYFVSQTMFLILLLPCSVLGYLIGFLIMMKAVDTGMFKNLLN